MRCAKFHICIIIVLIWNFCFAQEFTHYKTNDGLPSNHIYKAVQDLNGFIWVITDNGMVRYNGKSFLEFTTKNGLPTNDIWEIAISTDGKIWYFCKGSKIGYIENKKVYAFEAKEKGKVFFPLEIVEQGATIFFRSERFWYYLNQELQWENVAQAFDAMPKTNKDFIKLKLFTENLKKREKIQFAQFPRHMRQKDSLLFWVAEKNFGVYNLKSEKWLSRDTKSEYPVSHSFYARVNFINNTLQITDTDYCAVLDKNFTIEQTIAIPSNLNIHHTTVDKTGNLWSASLGKGLYKMPNSKRQITYYLNADNISSIHDFGDKIIACVYDKGYYTYTKTTMQFEPFIKLNGHIYPPYKSQALKKEYFIDGMNIIKNNWEAAKDNAKINYIPLATGTKQLVYFKGYLWGYGSYDLQKINPSNFNIESMYPNIAINKILPFNNMLVIGATDGLKLLETAEIVPLKNQELFKKPVQNIIALDSTTMLICTQGYGAYITDLKKSIALQNTEYLSVMDAAISNNELWLATNMGIYLFIKNGANFEFKTKYDEANGLPTRKINAVLALDENIMVATDQGLAVFPKKMVNTSQFLDMFLENMYYNSKKIEGTNPSFSYETNNSLNVKIGTINYSEMDAPISIRYKLLPNQTQWSETTSMNLTFSDLKPNDYTIVLETDTFNKKYSFAITPLWWQRGSFKLMGLFSIVLFAVVVLFQIRKFEISKKTAKIIAQKKLIEYELYALRSQMNPHFVFNSLAAIQYYINENDFETSDKYLVKFSKLIRQFFELSKESEITLTDEINLLKNYLEIEKLRFKDKLDYSFHIGQNIDPENIKIPTMLLQSVLENAVNHGIFNKAEPGNITISFNLLKNNTLRVEIKDDGVGFANAKKRKNGTINSSHILQNRIHKLNQSHWEISYSTEVAYPNRDQKGNSSVFEIKNVA